MITFEVIAFHSYGSWKHLSEPQSYINFSRSSRVNSRFSKHSVRCKFHVSARNSFIYCLGTKDESQAYMSIECARTSIISFLQLTSGDSQSITTKNASKNAWKNFFYAQKKSVHSLLKCERIAGRCKRFFLLLRGWREK